MDGGTYRGSRISYTLVWGPSFTKAAQACYPVGREVPVHYDPEDPARSVLEIRAPTF